MTRFVADYWPAIVVVVGAALVLARMLARRAADARFGVRRVGGRAGTIFVSLPTYSAQADFEMGADVNLIIYPQSLRDLEGRPLDRARQFETVDRLWSWAQARRLTMDVPGFSPPPGTSA